MDKTTWQELLSLESRDISQRRFKKIHSRELNARRAREINAAAKQAREYFRNATNSDLSVRPLLTFYGVTSLSRALLLLLKADGGEEGLSAGHGIETIGWGDVMSGDTSAGLMRLTDLKIRKRAGLFSDFVKYTNNRIAIHINTGGVDWRCSYDVPENDQEFSVADLFSRIPDLGSDYSDIASVLRYSAVNGLTCSSDAGFRMKVYRKSFLPFKAVYEACGYTITDDGDWCVVACEIETLKKEIPLFVHAYIDKNFGVIPRLFIAEPFSGGTRYSQLCITYMVAYVLGMLVRYYPTHWIALIQGDRGDFMWPTINRAQQLVEQTYPELVAEMVKDATGTGHPFSKNTSKGRE